jgi:hypothetical protein
MSPAGRLWNPDKAAMNSMLSTLFRDEGSIPRVRRSLGEGGLTTAPLIINNFRVGAEKVQ